MSSLLRGIACLPNGAAQGRGLKRALSGLPRTATGAASLWSGWLGTQSLECCNWHPPVNGDRFAQGLDAFDLVQGLRREVRLTTARA